LYLSHDYSPLNKERKEKGIEKGEWKEKSPEEKRASEKKRASKELLYRENIF
jgi:hypothetical protein